MKLNNGKGWEAMKQHPSQHMLHQPNAIPGASQRELHGTTRGGNSTPGHLTAARLNAAQPPPPSPIKPGMGKTRDRPNAPGGLAPKRSSGAAGGLQDVGTPAGSTQAQFQNSSNNLPQRMTAQPTMTAQAQQNGRPAEPQPSGIQKLMKALCCGS